MRAKSWGGYSEGDVEEKANLRSGIALNMSDNFLQNELGIRAVTQLTMLRLRRPWLVGATFHR